MFVFIHFCCEQGNLQQHSQQVINNFLIENYPQLKLRHTSQAISFEVSEEVLNSLKNEFSCWQNLAVDINILPKKISRNEIAAVAFDMDATVVAGETLDEFAKYVFADNHKIENLTKLAMNGKMSFADSLSARMNLLKGCPIEKLNEFLQKPILLNAGVKELIEFLDKQQIPKILISGGFVPFAKKVSQQLNFNKIYCNHFEVIDNKLSGNYLLPLIDAQGKKECLQSFCQENQFATNKILALGDGANDYPMLATSGYPIAYRGKAYLKSRIPCQLNYASMDAIIDFFDF